MTKTANAKSYTPAIVVMFALFFMIAFVTNLAGSMGVIVTNQFGASKALSQLGSLSSSVSWEWASSSSPDMSSPLPSMWPVHS